MATLLQRVQRLQSWHGCRTIQQLVAVAGVCGILIFSLALVFNTQDPATDDTIRPAHCVTNVNLTSFAESMDWGNYTTPDYEWLHDDNSCSTQTHTKGAGQCANQDRPSPQ